MEFLTKGIQEAVQSLYNAAVDADTLTLQETRKEFEGQVTLIVFPLTRISKSSPEKTGHEIGTYLQGHIAEVSDFNVVKGFLNISLSDAFWLNCFYQQKNSIGENMPANGKKVMVEYSSPNTNKPLHLGHVRNNLLGFSVAEILNTAGYDVIKTNLINDRGIHICKSMLAWQKFGDNETPGSSGLKGDHLVGKYYVIFDKEYKKQVDGLKLQGMAEDEAKKKVPMILEAQAMLQKWEAGDEEVISLWKKMNGWVYAGFDETYNRLGVSFDKMYYESDTYLLGKDLVEKGLASGVFFKKTDGSVWIDLTADGLDEKLVRRADGTSVYITQDLGTAQLKYNDFGMDESIYVVGNEQDYHFKVLFLILEKLGKSWAKGLYHLSYGMVDLPSGKMKSREGTVVDADDLMDEMETTAKNRTEELGKTEGFSEDEKQALYRMIGMGALKYFLLKVEPKKRLLFDPNESIDFQGHTGPFIQYTHARICSVLSKSEPVLTNPQPQKLETEERELIEIMSRFNNTVIASAKEHNPAGIANYAYELAKAYNKFYHEHTIIHEQNETVKDFRSHLSNATAGIIKQSMGMLGIEVPTRM